MEVVRIEPSLERPRLLLNQSIRLRFSSPLDVTSVGRPAVRVVDEAGRDVGGAFEVQAKDLIFRPRVPLRSDLSDGSLRPGKRVRLEVAGWPHSYALRDQLGRSLARSQAFDFEVPELVDHGAGLFLETHLPGDLFTLRTGPDGAPPTLAVGGRELVLDFSLPPLPTTARPAAFELVLYSGGETRAFLPDLVTILPTWRPGASEPRTAVRLTLPASAVPARGDKLYLSFASEAELVFRDFAGRPLQAFDPSGRPIDDPIQEVPSARLDWISLGLMDVGAEPGFEWTRGGRPVPRVRREAGRALRGAFRGGPSTRLEVGPEPLEFASFVVPEGTRTVLDLGGEAGVLRCAGAVQIDGELTVKGAPGGSAWERADGIFLERIVRDASLAILAAGPIRIRGRLVVETADGVGAPAVALVAPGRFEFTGEVPYGSFIGYEADPGPRGERGAQVVGAVPGNASGRCSLGQGAAEGLSVIARAQTRWVPLPEGREGSLVFDLPVPDGVDVVVELDGERDRPQLRFEGGRVEVPPGPETRFRLLLAADAALSYEPSEFGELSVSFR